MESSLWLQDREPMSAHHKCIQNSVSEQGAQGSMAAGASPEHSRSSQEARQVGEGLARQPE